MKRRQSLNPSCFAEQKKKMALRIKRVMKSWKLPTLLLSLLVFLVVCAAIFSGLESGNDRELYEKYHKRKISIRHKYNMSDKEFQEFMLEATYINKKGFAADYKDYWSFYHSFWFTITVITTMGFGQVVPVTFWGRMFCIFSALLGIPLNALVLKHVGENISKLISSIIRKIEKRCWNKDNTRNINVKCALVSFTLMVIVILTGGALDTIFDGWSFFDGVYFNFIALSTIGFGDLFPRVETATKLDRLGDNGKRIFVSSVMLIFMIIGLSVTSSVIYSIVKAIEEVSQIQFEWNRSGAVGGLGNIMSLRRLNRNRSCDIGNRTPKLPAINVIPACEQNDSETTATVDIVEISSIDDQDDNTKL